MTGIKRREGLTLQPSLYKELKGRLLVVFLPFFSSSVSRFSFFFCGFSPRPLRCRDHIHHLRFSHTLSSSVFRVPLENGRPTYFVPGQAKKRKKKEERGSRKVYYPASASPLAIICPPFLFFSTVDGLEIATQATATHATPDSISLILSPPPLLV